MSLGSEFIQVTSVFQICLVTNVTKHLPFLEIPKQLFVFTCIDSGPKFAFLVVLNICTLEHPQLASLIPKKVCTNPAFFIMWISKVLVVRLCSACICNKTLTAYEETTCWSFGNGERKSHRGWFQSKNNCWLLSCSRSSVPQTTWKHQLKELVW